MPRSRKIVYVSYDGMEEPLGRSQVLAYLRELATQGNTFELISFEKPPARSRFRERIYPGVHWTALRYHKEPTVPATGFDISAGTLTATLAAATTRADIVHVRSYVPGLMGATAASLTRTPLLFDMRGLWADERIEDGVWAPSGPLYRSAKAVERYLVRRASAITTLTNSMASYLRSEAPFRDLIRAPIHVIPTCTDLRRFSPDGERDPHLADQVRGSRVLTYVGSLGGRYLSKEMAEFYIQWRRFASPSRFLVVSRQDPVVIGETLALAGVGHELIHIRARPEEVPRLLRVAEAGVFFHPPTFTNRGAAPTKGGEMLATGLFVAGNQVGDVPEVIRESRVGVVLDDFAPGDLEAAARQLATMSRHLDRKVRARATAERWFSLEAGVRAYGDLYRMLAPRQTLVGTPDREWPRPSDPVA